ncbi:CARDB domain-containing protein [Halobellus rufus]|uniref:CARDB domain-containing protein n=1 Tax=Halobellus rufus TaxID=1448860 RepID=UPI0006786C1C|nr:CARDB domain-containing protein [Halobellus rufus]
MVNLSPQTSVSRSVLVACALVLVVALGSTVAGAAVVTSAESGPDRVHPNVAANDTEPERNGSFFEIQDVETNTPIKAGETVEVTVTVENVGDESGEKEVWFHLDEYYKDDAELQLAPGESETVTLTYVSKSDNVKDWTLRVDTPDDRYTRTVTIEEPAQADSGQRNAGGYSAGGSDGHPHFEITEMHVEESVMAGDTVRMNATVENTGNDLGEKLVWFALDGDTVNETIVELPEGESATVSTVLNTSVDDAGAHRITANTSDDVVSERVEFRQPEPEFVVESVSVPERIPAGEPLNVTATVGNVGDISGTAPVRLTIDGHFIDEERTEVELNETSNVTLQYRSNTWTTGEITAVVNAGEDNVTRSVTVFEPTLTTEDPTTATSTPEPVETESTTAAPESSSSGFDPSLPVLVFALVAGALAVTRWG